MRVEGVESISGNKMILPTRMLLKIECLHVIPISFIRNPTPTNEQHQYQRCEECIEGKNKKTIELVGMAVVGRRKPSLGCTVKGARRK